MWCGSSSLDARKACFEKNDIHDCIPIIIVQPELESVLFIFIAHCINIPAESESVCVVWSYDLVSRLSRSDISRERLVIGRYLVPTFKRFHEPRQSVTSPPLRLAMGIGGTAGSVGN